MSDIQNTSSSSSAALLTAVAGGALLMANRSAQAATSKPTLTFADIPGSGDIKVLNYALSLEALEADLYRQALLRLQGGDSAAGIPGLGLANSDPAVSYLRTFGAVESAHRDFLIAGIKGAGGTPITDSALKTASFDFGFTTASNYPDAASVVNLVLTAEALGVQAYLGAVPSFSVKSTYLQTAAAILGTEARHTAVVTALLNRITGGSLPVAPRKGEGLASAGIDVPLEPDAVLAKVSGPNGYIVITT